MLRWLLALLLVPFLDAVLLGALVVHVDGFGWVAMVALVVLTGLVGLIFVRAEGRRTLRKIERSLAAGEPPTDELLDGALLIAAGAFLLTPGLVTDLIGFAFVVPLTRIPIRATLKRYVVVPYVDRRTDGFASGAVWTYGFPDGAGPRGSGDRSGDTVDLGTGDYSVDDGGDDYTIEFGDGRTADGPDDTGDGRTDSDGDAVGR